MNTRNAVFAGRWYPDNRTVLSEMIGEFLQAHEALTQPIKALVSPHAGYLHSGKVAGHAFGVLSSVTRAVILCPNHRDRRVDRPAFAVAPHQSWSTPLGDVELDRELSQKIVADCDDAQFDAPAHSQEHAIELQLPFLKALNSKVKIVAISVATLNVEKLENLALALAKNISEDCLLIASSDMTHYQPRSTVMAKDRRALERVKQFDGVGLLDLCDREEISMCGRGPVVAVLKACQLMGAKEVRVLCHDTSKPAGDAEDDPVVGYAALAIF